MIYEKLFNPVMSRAFEFIDAFTSVGGRFFANTYEYIADNLDLDTAELIVRLYPLGYDRNKSVTSTRISSSKRLISNNYGIRALKKSCTFNQDKT